jgi:CheY-like chemotaxis protein
MSDSARILIVDDDREVRDTLQNILTVEGYQVVSAANGLEALELLDDGYRPCIILLDLMMPIIDGWQFLAERAASPALATIPVLVITATTAIRTVAHQHTAVLHKPFPVQDLLDRIDEYC